MADYCKTASARPRTGILKYIGEIVLGMNDALVEMTGALAGFTMALPNNRLIALAGLTTGVAATLSMAASEFLSQEAAGKRPWRAAFATGIAYLITVGLLLLPFFVCQSPFYALALCLFLAAVIILGFTWIVSCFSHTCFRRDFLRMLSISFSVAAISFMISWLARSWWNLDV